jgi:multiple sugar transport system ATP-binding protein
MNFLTGTVAHRNGAAHVDVGGASIPLPSGAAVAGEVTIGIRPEHIAVEFTPSAEAVPASVSVLEPIGSYQLLTAQVGADVIKVSVPPEFEADPGRRIWLRFDPRRVRLMDPQTGAAVAAS